MVTPKDYVNRKLPIRRRHNISRKKCNAQPMPKFWVAFALFSSLLLISIISFIIYNKRVIHHRQEAKRTPSILAENSRDINKLPPKPKERWRYVKTLENQWVGEPQEITTITNGRENKLSLMPKVSDSSTAATPPLVEDSHKLPLLSTINTKKNSSYWMLQCGSFRIVTQAESIRAQLALAGIESQIIEADGWNRVIIGPYRDLHASGSTLRKVKKTNIANCILVPAKGLK